MICRSDQERCYSICGCDFSVKRRQGYGKLYCKRPSRINSNLPKCEAALALTALVKAQAKDRFRVVGYPDNYARLTNGH